MSTIEYSPIPPRRKNRWYHLTPDRFLMGILMAEGFLLLSEWFCWFTFNERKGWTVLIAMAATGLGILFLLLWFAAALILRRRFQFSVRSLMGLVIAITILCSWFTVKRQQAMQQCEACELFHNHGDVVYNSQISCNSPERIPEWLQKMLGSDFFDDVEAVYLRKATGAELKHLENLHRLYSLWLIDTKFTHDGLESLKGLPQIRELIIINANITDAELEHIKGLNQLRWLELVNTKITDAGLMHFEGLNQLQYLSLIDTAVTDQGVQKIRQKLPNCKIIWQPTAKIASE
jgi:hypothetical protein